MALADTEIGCCECMSSAFVDASCEACGDCVCASVACDGCAVLADAWSGSCGSGCIEASEGSVVGELASFGNVMAVFDVCACVCSVDRFLRGLSGFLLRVRRGRGVCR